MAPETADDLRIIALEFPDALKWWLGDWIVAGERKFGVTLQTANEIANSGALLARLTGGAHGKLPQGIDADATSLTVGAAVTRVDWERLGGVLALLHGEIKDIPE